MKQSDVGPESFRRAEALRLPRRLLAKTFGVAFLTRRSFNEGGDVGRLLHRVEKRLHRKVGWDFLPRTTRNQK
jgi:hypothetical protein